MIMKTLKILGVLCVVLLLSSCKQDDWLDWKTQNELWLAENAKRAGVITTPTGLQYKCIYRPIPDNPEARPDNAKMVDVTYTGKLINDYPFNSAESALLYVKDLVPGFTEGLKKMTTHDTYEFYIPYQLGYGKEGVGTEGTSSHIPPYSTLIFRVTLNGIQ